MCTLIVLHRCVPGRPLVVAANRDEFLDRPAEGPAVRSRASGAILAPLDLEAGGTWLGLNAGGLFVGLTNLRPAVGPTEAEAASAGRDAGALLDAGPLAKPGLRSRGEVVMEALEARSAAEAAERIARLEDEAYNPFQLLVADRREAWLTVYRDSSSLRALEPGAHVVGNVEEDRFAAALGAAPTELPGAIAPGDSERPKAEKLARIRGRVEKILTESGRDLLEELAEICREHVEPNPFESTCVHVADRYGTRSSLLLELADERSASRLWASEGPPCERPFEDLTDLLGQLEASSSEETGAAALGAA